MDIERELLEQIEIVKNKLEMEYEDEIKNGIMQLIYKRYMNALEILKNKKDINQINILGGVRAYMDSYNDYNNPLLGELHKAEKLYKQLL